MERNLLKNSCLITVNNTRNGVIKIFLLIILVNFIFYDIDIELEKNLDKRLLNSIGIYDFEILNDKRVTTNNGDIFRVKKYRYEDVKCKNYKILDFISTNEFINSEYFNLFKEYKELEKCTEPLLNNDKNLVRITRKLDPLYDRNITDSKRLNIQILDFDNLNIILIDYVKIEYL